MKFIYAIILIFFNTLVFADNYKIPNNNKIIFEIVRKNKSIGTHSVEFEKINDLLNVYINVDIKVKFGFITIYK